MNEVDYADLRYKREVLQQLRGINPDAETGENSKGGKGAKTPYRFDLLRGPMARALFEVAERRAYGAEKYGAENYTLVDSGEHLNHALAHIFAHLAGDTSDKHLVGAATRLLMAISTQYPATGGYPGSQE